MMGVAYTMFVHLNSLRSPTGWLFHLLKAIRDTSKATSGFGASLGANLEPLSLTSILVTSTRDTWQSWPFSRHGQTSSHDCQMLAASTLPRRQGFSSLRSLSPFFLVSTGASWPAHPHLGRQPSEVWAPAVSKLKLSCQLSSSCQPKLAAGTGIAVWSQPAPDCHVSFRLEYGAGKLSEWSCAANLSKLTGDGVGSCQCVWNWQLPSLQSGDGTASQLSSRRTTTYECGPGSPTHPDVWIHGRHATVAQSQDEGWQNQASCC